MSSKIGEIASFDFIRYANCWEDADILLKGLDLKPGGKVLSIASAGDNSFSLLATNPEIVLAIDINPVQLYLVELKKAAIKHLSYDEVLAFLGFQACVHRETYFRKIKNDISPSARDYWEKHIDLLSQGVIYQGKFEKYFQLFRRRVLPLIHREKTIDQLLVEKSEQDQIEFYIQRWDSWRWRALFKFFFSKRIMGYLGRDPEFLKQVQISVGPYILAKAGRHLQSVGAQHNPMLHFQLKGNFGKTLPHYLQPSQYPLVQKNIDHLVLFEGYAEQAIQKYGVFHGMNLSNIFEYMTKDLFEQVANQLISALHPSARMAYWNLMVPRRISGLFPEKVMYQKHLSQELSDQDKGFFYNQFIVDQVC